MDYCTELTANLEDAGIGMLEIKGLNKKLLNYSADVSVVRLLKHP